jgi:hypothetical protein
VVFIPGYGITRYIENFYDTDGIIRFPCYGNNLPDREGFILQGAHAGDKTDKLIVIRTIGLVVGNFYGFFFVYGHTGNSIPEAIDNTGIAKRERKGCFIHIRIKDGPVFKHASIIHRYIISCHGTDGCWLSSSVLGSGSVSSYTPGTCSTARYQNCQENTYCLVTVHGCHLMSDYNL